MSSSLLTKAEEKVRIRDKLTSTARADLEGLRKVVDVNTWTEKGAVC
jgi:hypothetical protein